MTEIHVDHDVALLRTLTPEQKAKYLDRWNASPQWREAIATLYEREGIDLAEEGRLEAERRENRQRSALGRGSGKSCRDSSLSSVGRKWRPGSLGVLAIQQAKRLIPISSRSCTGHV